MAALTDFSSRVLSASVVLAYVAVGPLLAARGAIRRRVPAYVIGSLAAFWVFERLAAML